MIINGNHLLVAAPIKNMADTKISHNGVTYGLGEAGYDIRIKQEVVFSRSTYGQHAVVCVSDPNCAYPGGVAPSYYGRFALASAIEEFQMPPNLTGIVHDKSSWARRGLSVFNTVIEPGFHGGLTLELVYHGEEALIIPAGSGIAQVVFHSTSQDAYYNGKYQHQSTNPEPARES